MRSKLALPRDDRYNHFKARYTYNDTEIKLQHESRHLVGFELESILPYVHTGCSDCTRGLLGVS